MLFVKVLFILFWNMIMFNMFIIHMIQTTC